VVDDGRADVETIFLSGNGRLAAIDENCGAFFLRLADVALDPFFCLA